jgi:hypothetical protein
VKISPQISTIVNNIYKISNNILFIEKGYANEDSNNSSTKDDCQTRKKTLYQIPIMSGKKYVFLKRWFADDVDGVGSKMTDLRKKRKKTLLQRSILILGS